MTADVITARGRLHGHELEVTLSDGKLGGDAAARSIGDALVAGGARVGIPGVWTGKATLTGAPAAVMATLRAIFDGDDVQVEGLTVPPAEIPEHSVA
jgi:hypothetical protein